MFTGIITHIGKLVKKKGSLYTFQASNSLVKKIAVGDSIAVNGACLTVFQKPSSTAFTAEMMPETIKRTMFSKLKINDLVNLELPVTINSLFSGHIIQGHVDGTGIIENIIKDKNSKLLKITIPESMTNYIVEKGSIAVNGISLTVIKTETSYFTVGIIPHTWHNTMLKQVKIGDKVNIEVDILAKYLHKFFRSVIKRKSYGQ